MGSAPGIMGDGMSGQIAIREERSAAWWQSVIDHEAVSHIKQGHDLKAADLVRRVDVRPFASKSGGYIFVRLDVLGRVYELHAAYKPEGWGREAHQALKLALEVVDADVVLVTETANPQSRPPLSFGFRCGSDFRPSLIGEVRTWVLTRDAWAASVARRRMN